MFHTIAACLIALLWIGTDARGAELFYMDHDPFTDKFVGPNGPLVLSGDIVPGDYDALLSKISADPKRFLEQNKLLLASDSADAVEAIKIARLLKSLYIEVLVGPLTGRCVGSCFLIYCAANLRGTDGPDLIGLQRPFVDEARKAALSAAEATALDTATLAQSRALLLENGVPAALVEEMFSHAAPKTYWLSEEQERALGSRSASFNQLLAAKCAWSDAVEHEVYAGRRPFSDIKQMLACRARVTQPAALKALGAALQEKSARDSKPPDPH